MTGLNWGPLNIIGLVVGIAMMFYGIWLNSQEDHPAGERRGAFKNTVKTMIRGIFPTLQYFCVAFTIIFFIVISIRIAMRFPL